MTQTYEQRYCRKSSKILFNLVLKKKYWVKESVIGEATDRVLLVRPLCLLIWISVLQNCPLIPAKALETFRRSQHICKIYLSL